jgi:uncharacterized protein with von Willebrand factor type A (vWA) domain
MSDAPGTLVTGARHEPDELLLGFSRALRAAGVPVTMDRAQSFLAAVAVVGLDDQRATYWAGRATLCASPDDLDRYDQVFSAWFVEQDTHGRRQQPQDLPPAAQASLDELEVAGGGEVDDDPLRAQASAAEVLRHRDIGEMSPLEKARLAQMFEQLRPRAPWRRARRRTEWHRGEIDAARTMRRMLARMGEPAEIVWRRRARRPRRVVLLVDVSGSMSPYADALLRLAHRYVVSTGSGGATARGTEVFTIGTRLTRVTRAMRLRDADRAIIAAGETVPDWSGGTRLGETLRIFLDRWGQRGLARGAVVVIFSDGWERGDTALLSEQMRRLHALAHRVVWVNPHVGKDGYQPVQQGIVAALVHVDDFVAGHSLATFAELIEVVADA